ncbi:MAG TPA: ABC transporter ATP-binding protein [Spirochaetia bacterium]|nr:ABC transporter ATP-binding protein [Spirochaetia bacterium]
MRDAVLEAKNLSIGYLSGKGRRKLVAEGICLGLNPGETTCLIGPNGVGKSTLLRTLAGLQPPLDGNITIENRDISAFQPRELAQSVGIVLTEQVNVGMLSVFSLVELGRHPYTAWSGKLQPQDIEAVHWALEAVGALELAARNVSELSDGERQKVMIARALAQEPHVIILDEPTAFLDLPRRVEIMILLQNLARETGRAILLSTHDLDLALRCADVIWLFPPEGKLESGAPEDLVLSGALERTFRNRGIVFDRTHGSFLIQREKRGLIELEGAGFELVWSRRALEREGYEVTRGKRMDRPKVRVVTRGGIPSWQLTLEGESLTFSSIYELVKALRKSTTGHKPSRRKGDKGRSGDLDTGSQSRG